MPRLAKTHAVRGRKAIFEATGRFVARHYIVAMLAALPLWSNEVHKAPCGFKNGFGLYLSPYGNKEELSKADYLVEEIGEILDIV